MLGVNAVPSAQHARAWGFLGAAAAGAAIVLLRLPLNGVLQGEAPFILTWPAMMVAAFLGGFWPTLLVAALGLAVGHHVLTLAGEPTLGPGAIGIYFAFALVFAAAGGARKAHLRRAKADAERLDAMRARLLDVARLNAAGEMAGTLAHELNQPLTSVAAYMSAARRLLERDGVLKPQVAEVLDKATAQAVRAGEIVARVRGFVSRGEVRRQPESLPALLREAAQLALSGGEGRGVKLRLALDDEVDLVIADKVQVQQVLLNLIRNSVQAMAGAERRELTIGLRAMPPDLAQVTVSDTGPGLPADMRERLFEPFVTSKADGMGLGLSISRSIVEAHGGTLWFEANPDGGAAFHFTLERTERDGNR